VHHDRDNELPTEIKIPEEFDWVEEVGVHRCGATISSRFQDLAEHTERPQQAILTRELRSEWERLGRIIANTFHRNLGRFKELKTSKNRNVELAGDLVRDGIWPGNYVH